MSNNQVKLTALLRSIERRSLPECWTCPSGEERTYPDRPDF